MSDPPPKRPNGNERAAAIAIVAFVLGICVAGVVALFRIFALGLKNAPLFGTQPVHILRSSSDPTIWVMAVILTATTVLLFTLAIIERRKHRRLASAVVFGFIGAGITSFIWWDLQF